MSSKAHAYKKNAAIKQAKNAHSLGTALKAGLVVAGAVALLALGFGLNRPDGSSEAGQYPFMVGLPGPGNPAPDFTLPAGGGGSFTLSSARGQGVLLYFHEGGGCASCWVQLRDLEKSAPQLKQVGIDRVVSITTEPLDVQTQRAAHERTAIPLLSDATVQVSTAYTTNNYGMMNDRHNGHSFVLVDAQGIIRWRADYGGAPRYTMYVPMPNLLADIRQGLEGVD